VREPPEVIDPEVDPRPPFDPHAIGPELVEIGSYGGRFEGEMIRSLLRGSGIESMLTGDGTIYTEAYPLTVGPLSQVKVLVRPEDEEHAREVILTAGTYEPDDEVDQDDL
jgi:hypothetical protein